MHARTILRRSAEIARRHDGRRREMRARVKSAVDMRRCESARSRKIAWMAGETTGMSHRSRSLSRSSRQSGCKERGKQPTHTHLQLLIRRPQAVDCSGILSGLAFRKVRLLCGFDQLSGCAHRFFRKRLFCVRKLFPGIIFETLLPRSAICHGKLVWIAIAQFLPAQRNGHAHTLSAARRIWSDGGGAAVVAQVVEENTSFAR